MINNMLGKGVLLLFLLMLSVAGSAQSFSLTLTNQSSTSTTFDVDVMLTINSPAQGVRLASVSTGHCIQSRDIERRYPMYGQQLRFMVAGRQFKGRGVVRGEL